MSRTCSRAACAKSGNRVRLTVRLAEAASNTQVWSETYDYELGDIFAIQEEIAGQVATALNATLAGGPSHDPKEAALEPFLRAEFFYNRRAAGDIVRAVRSTTRRHSSIDPEYARAWASLLGRLRPARLWRRHAIGRKRSRSKVRRHASAVALDPESSPSDMRGLASTTGTSARSRIRLTGPWTARLRSIQNDLLVLTFLAGIAMRNGEVAGAIGRYDRIVARDPRSAAHHANRESSCRLRAASTRQSPSSRRRRNSARTWRRKST